MVIQRGAQLNFWYSCSSRLFLLHVVILPNELPYKNHVQEKHNIRFVLPSHFAT